MVGTGTCCPLWDDLGVDHPLPPSPTAKSDFSGPEFAAVRWRAMFSSSPKDNEDVVAGGFLPLWRCSDRPQRLSQASAASKLAQLSLLLGEGLEFKSCINYLLIVI